MKNLVRFILAILLVVHSYQASSSAAFSVPEDRWLNGSAGYARAIELQRELNVPLVIYFYADWCPYCHSLEGQYLPSAEVQDYLSQVVKVRINPEHGRPEQELASRYGVTGYPTFLVIRTPTARPLNMQPFRKGGANLTPAEFANACRQVAPVSRKETASSFNRSPSAVDTATRPSATQIVNVPRNTAATPEFIAEVAPPTLDQILGKYVEAMGGRAAQMRLTSRSTTGRVDLLGRSYGGKMESYAMAPNKSLLVMNIDSLGVMRKGFDGRIGWEQSDESGVSSLTGEGLASMARDADFHRDLKLKELYAGIKLIGRIKHGSREVYLVEGTPRLGQPEKLYFDAESGLLIRRDVTRQTARGPIASEIYYSDWRTVDGVKVPFKTTQIMPNQTFIFTVQEVKHNQPVDESIFRKPVK